MPFENWGTIVTRGNNALSNCDFVKIATKLKSFVTLILKWLIAKGIGISVIKVYRR